ncbi:glycosyltransferase family 9 protein, partial [Desulfovibrio sp. OttesenSCG-928-A18]|nr:glycosyltransferase family 9 protein [Desulfovibrio sp. OttesenSCG-928-A18]
MNKMPPASPATPPDTEIGPDAALAPPGTVGRILVCQLRQIGDVLLSTPAIELLAKHYPGAEIHVYTEKRCAPMLENNPHVHKIWELDKKSLPTPLHQFAFYRKVAANRYDLLVNFQHLPRCTWVAALSRARVKLAPQGRCFTRWLYTRQVPDLAGYSAAAKAGVLSPLGIRWNGEAPRLYLTDAEQRAGRELLRDMGLEGKDFISVDATHRSANRRWPERHYAALLDMLGREFPDLHFLLTYGPGEEEQVRSLRVLCRERDKVRLFPGVQSLRHVAACIAGAGLHLGNCSAPRHMAVALGVPSFTILGATGTGWTFPSEKHMHVQAKQFMDLSCQPCRRATCPEDLACLRKLDPELIFPLLAA